MSTNEIIVSLLSGTALFGGLAADEIAACAAGFRESVSPKGEMLFARGDAGTQLYLVAEGRVRLAIASEGRELSFRHGGAGRSVRRDRRPRRQSAQRRRNRAHAGAAYSLERNAFRTLWSTRSAIAAAVLRSCASACARPPSQLEAIALHPMDVRLARFLLLALGNRQAAPGKRLPLELGFSQSELAQLLGASRPKVNTALGALEGRRRHRADAGSLVLRSGQARRDRPAGRCLGASPAIALRVAAGLGALRVFLAAVLLMPGAWREGCARPASTWFLPSTSAGGAARPTRRVPRVSWSSISTADRSRRSAHGHGRATRWRGWSRPLPRETRRHRPRHPVRRTDGRSPAALARQLGALTGRPDLARSPRRLPDGDKRLAKASRRSSGRVRLRARSRSIAIRCPACRSSCAVPCAWSAVALRRRDRPAAAADRSRAEVWAPCRCPAMPTARFAACRSSWRWATGCVRASRSRRCDWRGSVGLPDRVRAAAADGRRSLDSLAGDALLRLAPLAADRPAARTVSAADVVDGNIDASRLAGTIVLIGGSAPELGGLRSTAMDPLTPSVQIQADAVRQIIAGRVPRPLEAAAPRGLPRWSRWVWSPGGRRRAFAAPRRRTVICRPLCSTWMIGARALADRRSAGRSADAVARRGARLRRHVGHRPLRDTRWREALVRQRFEQHLAPAVVRRIVQRSRRREALRRAARGDRACSPTSRTSPR